MARKPKRMPWLIGWTADATETARHLIAQAGGVGAAHDAVTRAAKAAKRKPGKPAVINDRWLLLYADHLRKHDRLRSDNAALMKVAGDDIKIVRRLRDKLKGKTLWHFAKHNQPPLRGRFLSENLG